MTDIAGGLRPETVQQLNAMITSLEGATGIEIAVVVITSLEGQSVEEIPEKLFELWGIGKKGRENGLLLLWSTGDRRVRVEVGYGLEGTLPDGKVGQILDTYIIPKFKAGEFDKGVIDGVAMLINVAQNEPVSLLSPRTESYASHGAGGLSFVSPTTLGIVGSIPAGIASIVGFRRWRRYRRRRCPQCQAAMARLGEVEDDALLETGQQAEEKVGSVDYDVWRCPSCSHHFVLRYPRWLTTYDKCPQCHNPRSRTETTIVAATTSHSGSARVVETCAFCSFRTEFTKTLPQLQERSSSSSSSRSSGGIRALEAGGQVAAGQAAGTEACRLPTGAPRRHLFLELNHRRPTPALVLRRLRVLQHQRMALEKGVDALPQLPRPEAVDDADFAEVGDHGVVQKA